jgi:hypothetical protein
MNDAALHSRRPVISALLVVSALLLLARCDLTSPVDERPFVVEAFLQTGAPLAPITLRTTQALDASAGDTNAPATGAEITLRLGSQHIDFQPVDSVPGRYAPAAAVTVLPRTAFDLTVQWQGRTAAAEGVTPPPITIESARVTVPPEPVQAILVDSLRRDSLGIPAEQGYLYPIDVAVTWTTDFPETGADSTYWIRAQLQPFTSFSSGTVVDFFLQPEDVFRERATNRGSNRRRWAGVYAVPVDAPTAPLPRHRVRVSLVRSNAAYAAFASSRQDPDRREPISNVRGAVGIAAGVAVDSVQITVDSASSTGESVRTSARIMQ